MKIWLTVSFAVLLTTGCISTSGLDRLLTRKTARRASYDFDCPGEKISVEKIDIGQYGASGCGRKAAYVAVGDCSTNNTANQVRVGCQMVRDAADGRGPNLQ